MRCWISQDIYHFIMAVVFTINYNYYSALKWLGKVTDLPTPAVSVARDCWVLFHPFRRGWCCFYLRRKCFFKVAIDLHVPKGVITRYQVWVAQGTRYTAPCFMLPMMCLELSRWGFGDSCWRNSWKPVFVIIDSVSSKGYCTNWSNE